MSDKSELADIIEQMETNSDKWVEFDPGLSDAEIESIEEDCNFQFPPDL